SEALAHRVLARKETIGHRLINDDDIGAILFIPVRKIASAYQRDAHQMKVAGRNITYVAFHLFTGRRRRTADDDIARGVAAHQRQHADSADRFDSGQILYAWQKLL